MDRSIRSLDQERSKLKIQENKLIAEMKKMAKEGQVKSVKIMATDLVRIRKHQEKFINLQAQLRAVSLQMQTMSSTQALTDSMKSAAKAMQKLNAQMQLPALTKIMAEFAKQTEVLEMKQGECWWSLSFSFISRPLLDSMSSFILIRSLSPLSLDPHPLFTEMIGDAIDDVMDNEEDVAESEQVVNQVLDEIGISLNEGRHHSTKLIHHGPHLHNLCIVAYLLRLLSSPCLWYLFPSLFVSPVSRPRRCPGQETSCRRGTSEKCTKG